MTTRTMSKRIRKGASSVQIDASQLKLALSPVSAGPRTTRSLDRSALLTESRECRIVAVGKRRDGGTRYWCLEHKADATAKYGRRAPHCRYAHEAPLKRADVLEIDTRAYAGGIALWGAVPPVYDTTRQPLDRGIHVHARAIAGGDKLIDQTFRAVLLRTYNAAGMPVEFSVSDLDAIYYMATAVFGYGIRYIECTYCGHPHLDKDWFSVHPHRRHLCAGCGRNFRDTEIAIGNPIAGIQEAIGHRTRIRPSKKKLRLRQRDFPGGIQIWGSNPAIVWTSGKHEEAGIHIHAFKEDGGCALPDDTFCEVVIDDIKLDPIQVQTLMAQSALPHIAGRVKEISCTKCGEPKFATKESAFTPAVTHHCDQCSREFPSTGRLRKVIANPMIGIVAQLQRHAVRTPQTHSLDLLPETL
jgi:NAD-dependent SIR2 family protein deacetylase